MDSVFFYLSKFVWLLLAPASWLLFLVSAAWLALQFGKPKLGRRLLASAAFILLCLSVLPVGEWFIAPLENRIPSAASLPADVTGIIVLSGALDPVLSASWGQAETGGAAERLMAFAALAQVYPQAQLVFTGGSGSVKTQQYGAADYVGQLFTQLGIGSSRILYEGAARNTYENVVNSKTLVQPSAGETWVLVTSAFHMPRSVGIFCQQGWDVIPYSVDHYSVRGQPFRFEVDLAKQLDMLDVALHEWLGLLAYHLSGKTHQLFPQSSC
jgi:uncharacterized SAM-binding protein YcdF (DUF218 family)